MGILLVAANATMAFTQESGRSGLLADSASRLRDSGFVKSNARGPLMVSVPLVIVAESLVATRAITNMADLLTARDPSMQVLPGTSPAAGFRTRIRGTSTLLGSNEPVFIVDGVRIESSVEGSTVTAGGVYPARVNDLDPDEIESIELFRGPASAALLDAGAGNGVVVIKTRRGAPGAARWSYYTEQTAVQDRGSYATAYRAWSHTPGYVAYGCPLTRATSGACTVDSLTQFNVMDDRQASPRATAYRQQQGLQVRGGTSWLNYFVAGAREGEDGVTRMPDFSQRRLEGLGLSVQPQWRDPDALARRTARANLDFSLPWNASIAVSAGHIALDQRASPSGNSDFGEVDALLGPGTGTMTSAGDSLHGFGWSTPARSYRLETGQTVGRTMGSLVATVPLRDWLSLVASTGRDQLVQDDRQFDSAPDNGYTTVTTSGHSTGNIVNSELRATASYAPWVGVLSRTMIGTQRRRARNDSESQTVLTLGTGFVQSISKFQSDLRESATMIDEELSLHDRLVIDVGARIDKVNLFNDRAVWHPRVAASWLAMDRPTGRTWIDELRVRAAYGSSSVPVTGATYFSAVQSLGILSLARPEQVKELEGGVDARMLNGRVALALTAYQRTGSDLWLPWYPGSSGYGGYGYGYNTNAPNNTADVRNRGIEAHTAIRVLEEPAAAWDLDLAVATNANRVMSLAGPPLASSFAQTKIGYPVSAYWMQTFGYADSDGNGSITANEIVPGIVDYLGSPSPTRAAILTNGVDLIARKLRLSASIDYKGGYKVRNYTEEIRCAAGVCRAVNDASAPLFDQARAVAASLPYSSRSYAGYFEDGDVIRLREIGATYTSTPALLRGRTISATLAARNLRVLWTKYSGTDPDAALPVGESQQDLFMPAPPTYFSFHLSVGL